MKFKIAVVQFRITPYAPQENLKKAEKFISKAASSGARIIVFPEDFITGPVEGEKNYADSKHRYRDYFQNLAKKYRIDIVPGSFVEKEKNLFYNTTYYLDHTSKNKARYRKINLWSTERKFFTPGKETTVFKTRFGKIGLIICWDIFFPEIFRKMVKKGVNMVICPSYWCYEYAEKGLQYDANSEIKLVDALCVSRAFENEIALIYTSAAGTMTFPNYREKLLGHSQVTVPFKGAIKKLEHNREEMFIQEIDTEILKDAEKVYKTRENL